MVQFRSRHPPHEINMKGIFCYLFLWCNIHSVHSMFYKSNLTDLTKCQVHYSRSGSVYTDFYSLSKIPSENDSLLVDFHFAVLAPSDAHILLAPFSTVEKGDPAYEIVIGAGGDTFCDIRRSQKANVKASVRIRDLLSALDPNSFWIHITKDGAIGVGREGEELPFISWIDPDPLPIQVISFSAWSGIEAKWYFDCERPEEIVPIEKNLTYTEKLRQDLLHHYNPYNRPVKNMSTLTTINVALIMNHINLDEHKSTLEITGITKMTWQDELISWDPDEYGGVETMHIFGREIWRPDIFLFNAVGDGRDIIHDSLMVAHSSGSVAWAPNIYLKAWCSLNNMERWPKDVHKCHIILGFLKDYESIQLSFNRNDSVLVYRDLSEWAILQAELYANINDTYGRPVFSMVLTIQRISDAYNAIFFTPFLIISVSLLSTFWVDAFGKLKISLNCAQLVLSTIMLLTLGTFIPSHSARVPYLVLLYSFTLAATVVAVIIAIIVINLSRNTQKSTLPHYVCRVLTSKAMRIGLLLPKMNMSDEYGKLHDFSTGPQEKQQIMWILLGVAIDRISFLIYLPLIIYAIYMNCS